jgi:mRNA interferase RelE/StbE
MNVEFDTSFEKSLDRLNNPVIFRRIERIIIQIESAKSLSELSNIKKLTGFQKYFRIRIGDYRLGIESIDRNTIRFIIIAHRKDIYKSFP